MDAIAENDASKTQPSKQYIIGAVGPRKHPWRDADEISVIIDILGILSEGKPLSNRAGEIPWPEAKTTPPVVPSGRDPGASYSFRGGVLRK